MREGGKKGGREEDRERKEGERGKEEERKRERDRLTQHIYITCIYQTLPLMGRSIVIET